MDETRITQLETRLAQAEARIAALESRGMTVTVPAAQPPYVETTCQYCKLPLSQCRGHIICSANEYGATTS